MSMTLVLERGGVVVVVVEVEVEAVDFLVLKRLLNMFWKRDGEEGSVVDVVLLFFFLLFDALAVDVKHCFCSLEWRRYRCNMVTFFFFLP
jgi:hypothetical protein